MVSKFHFPLKEPKFFGEMAESRASTGNVQDESRTPVVSKRKKADGDMSKAHKSPFKRPSLAKPMWAEHQNYDPMNKIRTLKSIPI